MIQFSCVGCGKRLQIDDQWAGKLGNCAFCQTISPVPNPQQQADYPKRSSRLGIIARIIAYPAFVMLVWITFLWLVGAGDWILPWLTGGVIALACSVLFLWGATNLLMRIICPKEMRLWKKGGGDPFFDTLSPPFNPDPPEVRYQELYEEKMRQEVDRRL